MIPDVEHLPPKLRADAICRFVEYIVMCPAERARREALIAEFVPSDDEIAAGLPKLVTWLDVDEPDGEQREPEHVEPQPKHDPDTMLDDLDTDSIAAAGDPGPGIETPIVEHVKQHVDLAPVTEAVEPGDAELRSVMAGIEAGDFGYEEARNHWHRTKDRLNDEPDAFIAAIRRAVPAYGDAVADFVEKRNRANAKDRELGKAAAHAFGVRKRKATWAVKSPVELRAERKKQMARERQQRCRAARRAAKPRDAGDHA